MTDEKILAPPRAAKPFLGTREEARAAGAVRYINGLPCNRGHEPTIRLTSNTQCVACRDMKQAELKSDAATQKKPGFSIDIFWGEHPVYVGTRTEAEKAGAPHYYNARRPCTEGHDPTIRLVSTTACVKCAQEYHVDHRDEILERKRDNWHENGEENRAASRERYAEDPTPWKEGAKRNRLENPERKKATDANWIAAHPEEAADYGRRWRKANPGKVVAKAERRRARIFGCTEHYTAEDIELIFRLQGRRCAACGIPLDRVEARDHIVALAIGGDNSRGNAQVLDQRCNARKGILSMEAFMLKEFGKVWAEPPWRALLRDPELTLEQIEATVFGESLPEAAD